MKWLASLALFEILAASMCLGQQANNPELPLSLDKGAAAAPKNPLPAGVQKLDLKTGMHPPKAIHQPDFEFSSEAREKNINGKCLIAMIVDVDGNPRDIHVVRCSDMVFAKPTMAAVSQYRFKPATTVNNVPVAVSIHIVVEFHREGADKVVDPILPILFGFGTPPGTASDSPDINGVYPFTKLISPIAIQRYEDRGYYLLGFQSEERAICEIVLTIDVKGKASEPKPLKCENENIEKAVIASLMASRYKPGSLGGKAVATRVLVHVEYGDFPTQH